MYDGVLVSEITFGPPDMQNDYPRHPQTFTVTITFSGV